MTQFTIESLTRKDDVVPPRNPSPPAAQRETFINAMGILTSSSIHWDTRDGDSEGRSRPSSSDSDLNSPPFQSTESGKECDEPSSSTSPSSSLATSPNSSSSQSSDDKSGKSPNERQKPPHSYIALIAMAILKSPPKRLLLCDIYDFIMENFPYFRNNERSWRNSIRHNLSLNECFIKAGRSDDGRGHFWAVHPANMEDFSRGDYRRRRARRRVRAIADYDVFGYPYQYYPTPMPSHLGYVPMTYSPITSIFPSGITPYMTPRLPALHSTMPPSYVPAATSTVPSMSSPLPCLSSSPMPPVCSSSSMSRISPIMCSSPSFTHSPHLARSSPMYTRASAVLPTYSREPWTPYARSFHPYNSA